ncbi:MAG: pentapeptide repeat-containing protein [Caldilineaceae bacterium]
MIFINRRLKNRIILNLVIFGVLGISAPFLVYYLMLQTISCTPDCIGANLTSRDLQGMNFANATFVEANMSSANLASTNLRDADLSGAKLNQANLRSADLTDAKLIGADLSNADLTGSILNGADFSGANLDNADLTGVDLTETGVSGASFVKANLTNAQLSNTNLMGIDFTDAILAGADLQHTRLTGASLSRADLSGALLAEADLTGAWLNLTNLKGVDLSGASLLGSMLVGGQLASANLAGSDLKGTLTVGASFDGANLRGADLRQMRLTATQLVTDELRLDPVLKGLNQLQLAQLRINANLNGVQFDAHTQWPANVPLRGITNTVSTSLPKPAKPITQGKTALGENIPPLPIVQSVTKAPDSTYATAPSPTAQLAETQSINAKQVLSTTASGGQGESPTSLTENGDTSQVRHVKVNFFINSLRNIDSRREVFQTDFYIDFFWAQPELNNQDISKVQTDKLFDPLLDTVNSYNAHFLQKFYYNSFEPDTNVRLRTFMTGAFLSPFDLRRFPFDQQILSIKLESTDFDSEHLLFDFAGLPRPIVHSERPYIQSIPKGRYVDRAAAPLGWRVQDAKVVQQIHVLPYDNSSWSQLRIDLVLQREAAPYIWKITLVFMFIILMTWSVFWLDGEAVHYRLWLLFLALVITHVFNAVLWKTVPNVPYLTFLDRYLLLCYGSIGWMIAAVLVIKRFYNRKYITWALWLNRGLMLLYPISWIIATVGLFWNVMR